MRRTKTYISSRQTNMQRKTDGNKQTVTEQSTKTDRWKLVDMRRQTETDSEGRDRQRRTVTERKTDKQTETDGMICCTIQYIFTGCCGLCTEACIYQVILFLYVGNNSNMIILYPVPSFKATSFPLSTIRRGWWFILNYSAILSANFFLQKAYVIFSMYSTIFVDVL